jgi:hypothetical protein
MADEFVLPNDIGTIDCSDIQPWDRKSLRYDYILKATTGDEDYPIVTEEVGICTNLWVHGNAQIDNIQINQTITGNPTSYLGDVTAGDINSTDINVNGTVTADYFIGNGGGLSGIGGANIGAAGLNGQVQYNDGSLGGASQLYYDDINHRVGIGTSIPTSKLHVVGNVVITGITTVGIASTSSLTSNSTFSFELTSDTNLRVRVRGTDGVIRSANLTLS